MTGVQTCALPIYNLNIATELSGADGIELVVTGGNFRRSDGGLIGDLAKQTIRQFRFDYAIIGCSALHEDGDIDRKSVV